MKTIMYCLALACLCMSCEKKLKKAKALNYNRCWRMSVHDVKDSMRTNSRWHILTSKSMERDRLEYISPKNDSLLIYWIDKNRPWKIDMSYALPSELLEPQGVKSSKEDNTWYDQYNNVKVVRQQTDEKSIQDVFEPIDKEEQ